MISVIVPSHNRKRNLELTLTGLVNQSLSKDLYEVILVDDGSDDGTIQLVDTFKAQFGLKYAWIYKKDIWNASRPRNYGAKLSEKTTEAFVFVDSDVVLNPKALQFYYEVFEKNKERVIIGQYDWTIPQLITADDITHSFNRLKNNGFPRLTVQGSLGYIGVDTRKPSFEKGTPDDLFGEVFDGLACFGGNLLVPKDIFWKAGGYDENIFNGCEDGDFGLTLWEMGVKFSYDSRTIGYHIWHPLSKHRAENARQDVDKLNIKHFGTSDQKLIDYTKEAYRRWGIDWTPPPDWIDEQGKDKI